MPLKLPPVQFSLIYGRVSIEKFLKTEILLTLKLYKFYKYGWHCTEKSFFHFTAMNFLVIIYNFDICHQPLHAYCEAVLIKWKHNFNFLSSICDINKLLLDVPAVLNDWLSMLEMRWLSTADHAMEPCTLHMDIDINIWEKVHKEQKNNEHEPSNKFDFISLVYTSFKKDIPM